MQQGLIAATGRPPASEDGVRWGVLRDLSDAEYWGVIRNQLSYGRAVVAGGNGQVVTVLETPVVNGILTVRLRATTGEVTELAFAEFRQRFNQGISYA